jgi:hypothetical protein
VSRLHTRSFQVSKGRLFSVVLPDGAGPLVAHEGETVLIVVAHSYEAAVGEALRRLHETEPSK